MPPKNWLRHCKMRLSWIDPEWEVVHPDVPLSASENCSGEFSVPGNEWLNQDHEEEYTNCWPMEWLPEDYPNTRIIGIDYTSAVTEWSANFTKYCPCEKSQGHLDERATSLLERITMADIGNDRPVVWIDHLSLSKPIFRQSFLYQRLLQVIDETVNENLKPDLKEQLPIKKFETHSLKSTTPQNASLLQQTKDILSLIPQILFKFSTT